MRASAPGGRSDGWQRATGLGSGDCTATAPGAPPGGSPQRPFCTATGGHPLPPRRERRPRRRRHPVRDGTRQGQVRVAQGSPAGRRPAFRLSRYTFRFDRRWTFPVPPAQLWEALSRSDDYPTWWTWLRRFDGDGLVEGGRPRCEVRAPLPYSLRFTVDV